MFNEASRKEKRIMITGCTSGIGYSIAGYLDELGYDLFLVGRNGSKLKEVSSEFHDAPFFVADLMINDSIKGIFDHCVSNGYRLDGLIHSAGIAINTPIRKYSPDDLKAQMQINCFSFIEMCKHFCSNKISNEGSSIVTISSYATYTQKKGSVMYVSSKKALEAAVSIASKEYIKRGIRVNAIAPSYVDTRMNTDIEEILDLKKVQPMGLIPPIQIAYLTEFLLSERSGYITGSVIPVSAGMEGQ